MHERAQYDADREKVLKIEVNHEEERYQRNNRLFIIIITLHRTCLTDPHYVSVLFERRCSLSYLGVLETDLIAK